MKYIIFSTSLFFLIASCGSKCNSSTPEGMAYCLCDYEKDLTAAHIARDDAKKKEIDDRMQALGIEMEEYLLAGDYTEADVEVAITKIDCNN